ncbi:hypothetical protein BC332_12845 [Capsicum chinense]|nr:hypothetical protein BC332_12845 [Capsicum chinense]
MDEAHPLNTPMVVQSLDVTKDPFRRQEKQEKILGSEVPYLSAIDALMYLANSTRPDIVASVNLSVRRDTLIWHVRVYTRVYTQELGHELMRIAVMFEEKVYTAATSLLSRHDVCILTEIYLILQQDYLQRICLKMRTIDIRSQNRVINPLLPNAASSGPNAHGPEAVSYETISGPVVSDEDEDAEDVSKEDSLEEVAMTKERKSAVGHKENVKVGENETGNANGADWQEEAYQKIKSMREMYLSELFTVKLLLKCRSLQHQESQGANGNKYISFEHKSDMDNGRNASSADRETNLDSTSQMGNADGADWYEELYLKVLFALVYLFVQDFVCFNVDFDELSALTTNPFILSHFISEIELMKICNADQDSEGEALNSEITDLYQRIAFAVQLDSLPQRLQHEQVEKLKMFKSNLEHIMIFLQLNKHDIQLTHKEKLCSVEKHISFFLLKRLRKPTSSPSWGGQGQLPLSCMQLQQPQSLDVQANPPTQPVHGFMPAMQQNNLTNLQHLSLSGVNTVQPGSGVATGSLPQNPVNYSPQQVNISSLSSQSGTNPVQANFGSLQQNSSIPQQSLFELHEQQMLQGQQLRQMYEQMQQQTFHSQQLMQHQQLFHRHQLLQQQAMQQQLMQQQQEMQLQIVQLRARQMSRLHQVTDANDLMMRQQMGMNMEVLQQQQSVGQHVGSLHPQLKSGISLP